MFLSNWTSSMGILTRVLWVLSVFTEFVRLTSCKTVIPLWSENWRINKVTRVLFFFSYRRESPKCVNRFIYLVKCKICCIWKWKWGKNMVHKKMICVWNNTLQSFWKYSQIRKILQLTWIRVHIAGNSRIKTLSTWKSYLNFELHIFKHFHTRRWFSFLWFERKLM